MIWRWDQGRKTYFEYEAVKNIAPVLVEFHGSDLGAVDSHFRDRLITKAYPVYKIRLDWLYYNDQNDRIATWISQYRSEHNGQSISLDNKEQYNAAIEKFICESNPAAIRKTKANIKEVDQREPAVVLFDGRIIDGNRRFTCLRLLAKENERFNYLEAVILPEVEGRDSKHIKMLELSLQHGEEGKVDYNPVDFANVR